MVLDSANGRFSYCFLYKKIEKELMNLDTRKGVSSFFLQILVCIYKIIVNLFIMVHLADNSSLIYPEAFGRGDRNVCLEGEGNFLVAHDRIRRFIVHTPHGHRFGNSHRERPIGRLLT